MSKEALSPNEAFAQPVSDASRSIITKSAKAEDFVFIVSNILFDTFGEIVGGADQIEAKLGGDGFRHRRHCR
ncbi:hypothetical protein [Geminisphaera colitermitum]|uniref:hypothetical protein n=1 Tax=Geminisphaera colitermitum TaxID=1148786 RepID=UPI0005BBDF04|nr:hypothetical protein [Geminisphaera colitermitum]